MPANPSDSNSQLPHYLLLQFKAYHRPGMTNNDSVGTRLICSSVRVPAQSFALRLFLLSFPQRFFPFGSVAGTLFFASSNKLHSAVRGISARFAAAPLPSKACFPPGALQGPHPFRAEHRSFAGSSSFPQRFFPLKNQQLRLQQRGLMQPINMPHVHLHLFGNLLPRKIA